MAPRPCWDVEEVVWGLCHPQSQPGQGQRDPLPLPALEVEDGAGDGRRKAALSCFYLPLSTGSAQSIAQSLALTPCINAVPRSDLHPPPRCSQPRGSPHALLHLQPPGPFPHPFCLSLLGRSQPKFSPDPPPKLQEQPPAPTRTLQPGASRGQGGVRCALGSWWSEHGGELLATAGAVMVCLLSACLEPPRGVCRLSHASPPTPQLLRSSEDQAKAALGTNQTSIAMDVEASHSSLRGRGTSLRHQHPQLGRFLGG